MGAYSFPVPKYTLQKIIIEVIAKESNIKIAPITDTFTSKYYNDGERYVTIQIAGRGALSEYTFQYTGKKQDCDTSKTSEISVAYANDKKGNGGSADDISSKLKSHLLDIFKIEFVDKINLLLAKKTALDNLNHCSSLSHVCKLLGEMKLRNVVYILRRRNCKEVL